MAATKFWNRLAEEGPIRDFQLRLERESEGLNKKAFAEKWGRVLGYSDTSVTHWIRGSRKIPSRALMILETVLKSDTQKVSQSPSMGSASRAIKQRQDAIDRMCAGCALGDRFCRISDCPIREFSPLPLHPKAVKMGWDEHEPELS